MEKKDTLLGLENEHCIQMISVIATINGSVSDVTGGLNSAIMDISHAFYHFKWGYNYVQILTKLQENVAIVSCVTLNFTYCVSTCLSLDKEA